MCLMETWQNPIHKQTSARLLFKRMKPGAFKEKNEEIRLGFSIYLYTDNWYCLSVFVVSFAIIYMCCK